MPPPLPSEVFRKFIRFGSPACPLPRSDWSCFHKLFPFSKLCLPKYKARTTVSLTHDAMLQGRGVLMARAADFYHARTEKSKRWQWIFSHILIANQLTYHQASWRSFCWNKQGISLKKLCFMWEWKWRTNVWDIKLYVKVQVLEWEKPRENLLGDPLIGEW